MPYECSPALRGISRGKVLIQTPTPTRAGFDRLRTIPGLPVHTEVRDATGGQLLGLGLPSSTSLGMRVGRGVPLGDSLLRRSVLATDRNAKENLCPVMLLVQPKTGPEEEETCEPTWRREEVLT